MTTNEGPALDSRALAINGSRDLVHLMGMARRVAGRDSVSLASAPQQPYSSRDPLLVVCISSSTRSTLGHAFESCLRHSAMH